MENKQEKEMNWEEPELKEISAKSALGANCGPGSTANPNCTSGGSANSVCSPTGGSVN
jgi:SynChlorMet cassette protein ScmA